MILENGGGLSGSLRAENGFMWRCVTDTVMGGVSTGRVARTVIDNRPALRMTGDVSLRNNGGFVQMVLDLAANGAAFNASRFQGLSLLVRGNGAGYNIHLRSPDMDRVWQSWRFNFKAPQDWTELRVGFAEFQPYRTELPVSPSRLSRIGLVAIGKEMRADLALSRLELVEVL